ncbi:MAG: hypothetical protein AB8H12_04870 [Lewinella sp.]
MSRLTYIKQRARLPFQLAGLRFRRLRALVGKPLTGRGVLDVWFALLDLIGFFDGYELLTNTFFPNTRPLSVEEYNLLFPIFGDSVPYHLIRIDERALIGPSWAKFFYVSFHTINSWGPMRPPTLVHEVVHVWQYTHRGAAYIPRALYAQTTPEGYNYGGLEPLQQHSELEDFNYEQQADIIEDAFRLANGYQAQWVRGRGAEVLPMYYPYLEEIRSKHYSSPII